MAVADANSVTAATAAREPRSAWRHAAGQFLRSLMANKVGVAALAIIVVVSLYAVVGSHLTTHDPEFPTADRLQGPRLDHLFWTDNLVRYLYSLPYER